MDLGPTVLAMLEVPVPAELDGRVRSDLVAGLEAARIEEAAGEADEATPYTEAEEAAVEERLKDLGYL